MPGWPVSVRAFALSLPLSFVALLPGVARASELTWEGPGACNERDQLSFQIEQALGAPLAKVADLQFAVRIERAEAPLVARLRVTRAGAEAPKERVLTGPNCDKLVDTLTVAVALALGAHDLTEESSAREPLPAPPEPPAAREATAEAAAPESEPESAPESAPERGGAGFGAGALALLVSDIGSLPEPALGARVGVELGWRALRLQLTGTMFFDQHVELAAASARPAGADVNLAVGAALACTDALGVPASRLEVPLCAGVELGRLAGVGRGVLDAREEAVPWVAPLLEAGLFWGIPSTLLRFGALFSAVVPLNRDEFVLRGLGSVHRPSSFAARGSLGLDVHFE